MDSSLLLRHPKAFDVPILIVAATVLLGFGLFLPVITLEELVFWKHTFSVLTGIESLWNEKHYILAVVVFLFSLIFPIVKLSALYILWFKKMNQAQLEKVVHRLAIMGKWSMLDVFVVAIMVVVAKVSGLASARPENGIYFFGASIILAIIATMRVEKLIKE